mmetsp:Transcript_53800/g.95861  ORF Transcript_53800/g.95861 Transcript_53800/m.95861 type:complete len:289 (-) Transcript_53800:3408-4274(-)
MSWCTLLRSRCNLATSFRCFSSSSETTDAVLSSTSWICCCQSLGRTFFRRRFGFRFGLASEDGVVHSLRHSRVSSNSTSVLECSTFRPSQVSVCSCNRHRHRSSSPAISLYWVCSSSYCACNTCVSCNAHSCSYRTSLLTRSSIPSTVSTPTTNAASESSASCDDIHELGVLPKAGHCRCRTTLLGGGAPASGMVSPLVSLSLSESCSCLPGDLSTSLVLTWLLSVLLSRTSRFCAKCTKSRSRSPRSRSSSRSCRLCRRSHSISLSVRPSRGYVLASTCGFWLDLTG